MSSMSKNVEQVVNVDGGSSESQLGTVVNSVVSGVEKAHVGAGKTSDKALDMAIKYEGRIADRDVEIAILKAEIAKLKGDNENKILVSSTTPLGNTNIEFEGSEAKALVGKLDKKLLLENESLAKELYHAKREVVDIRREKNEAVEEAKLEVEAKFREELLDQKKEIEYYINKVDTASAEFRNYRIAVNSRTALLKDELNRLQRNQARFIRFPKKTTLKHLSDIVNEYSAC